MPEALLSPSSKNISPEEDASEEIVRESVPMTDTAIESLTQESPAAPRMESGEQAAESPKSLFSRAYEAVRNTEVVSNIVDHVQVWYTGRHINAMEEDIKRLQGLEQVHQKNAQQYENQIQVSSGVKGRVDAMRGKLNIPDMNNEHATERNNEEKKVQSRVEMHRANAESTKRELAEKIALQEQLKTDRENAKQRIIGRFESKIRDNERAMASVQSAMDAIVENSRIGEGFVQNLRQERETLQLDLQNNPSMFSADKNAIQQMMGEVDVRIGRFRGAMEAQKAQVGRYVLKKEALGTQTNKWKARIEQKKAVWNGTEATNKAMPEKKNEVKSAQEIREAAPEEEVPAPEREETNENAAIRENKEPEKSDPREEMLEDLQALMENPNFAKYGEETIQEAIEKNGTPEQKLLVESNKFFTKLFTFLESPEQAEEKKEERSAQQEIIDAAFKKIEKSLEREGLEEYIEKGRRAEVERSGSKEEKLLVLLLTLIEDIVASFQTVEGRDKEEPNQKI